jgi:hypothetical protein
MTRVCNVKNGGRFTRPPLLYLDDWLDCNIVVNR